jgi:hypothetical protein
MVTSLHHSVKGFHFSYLVLVLVNFMDKFYNFNQVFPKLFLEVYKKYTQKFEKGKHK